jgi:ribosomal protein L11 methyltransferase
MPSGALALAQIPSDAFGDGTHPTTRLCAIAVDHLCRTEAPGSVLDVGTGTGVLARIARARGASRVVGTDIDPLALASARANAALDAYLIEIELSAELPHAWGPSFDLVIANILEGPLRQLAPFLRQALVPGGLLLLSGFTPLQVPSLKTAFVAQDLTWVNEATLEGWCVAQLKLETELS